MIEENTYVRDGGVWKIKSPHVYINFIAPHVGGWLRLQPVAEDWRTEAAKAFPSDRPPTDRYRPSPDAEHPAVPHYKNPGDRPRPFEGAEMIAAGFPSSSPPPWPSRHLHSPHRTPPR